MHALYHVLHFSVAAAVFAWTHLHNRDASMQERPEEVPTGELPQNMTLIVDRHLVGKISPGTRLTVIGIYSIYQVCFTVVHSYFSSMPSYWLSATPKDFLLVM